MLYSLKGLLIGFAAFLFIARIAMFIESVYSTQSINAQTSADILDRELAEKETFRIKAEKELIEKLILVEQKTFGRPVLIRIPAIKVDAKLENIGLKSDGTLGAPKGPVNAGWYYSGPLPGHVGNSIIDGHYGWRDGIQAVFDNLSKLNPGDKIYVEDQKGIPIIFVVTEVALFSENESTERVFNSSDNKPHLILITCGGIWDKVEKRYANRTVVFSNLLVEQP